MKWIQVLIAGLFLGSCKEEIKFDKKGWKEEYDGFYKNREKMIKDLMENYQLKGFTYQQVINLLGQPDEHSGLKAGVYINYSIVIDYGHDIDPVYTKDLEIRLNIDSIVEQVT